MPDVDASRSETLEPTHFRFLVVIRTKIEVDAIRGGLPAVGWHQTESAAGAVRCDDQMSARGPGPHVLEVKGLAPECGYRFKVYTVDQNKVDASGMFIILAVTPARPLSALH